MSSPSSRPDFAKNKLLPVVVQDDQSNEVLTLAYMNAEAWDNTIATGDVTFFSRSRNVLWRKGETSGNTMRVVSAAIDCDNDAILLRVKPSGPACHTGERSCSFNKIR